MPISKTSRYSKQQVQMQHPVLASYALIPFLIGHPFGNPEHITESLKPGMCTGYPKDETIVRVRGLPWQVSDRDVASFFRGLSISKYVRR